jgi:hypothetical protein
LGILFFRFFRGVLITIFFALPVLWESCDFLRFFQKNIWMVFLLVWCAGIHSPFFDNLVLQQQPSSSLRAFRDFFLWFFLFNCIFSAKEVVSRNFFCFYFVGRIWFVRGLES